MEEDDDISDIGLSQNQEQQDNNNVENQEDQENPDQNDGEQDGENQQNQEQKEKKKRNVQIFRFKPTMLMDKKKGLEFLYKKSKKLKFEDPESREFNEQENLSKLLLFTKEWHYYFMPKYSYDYFIDRCQFYGEKKPEIKGYMDRLRRCHKGEMRFSDIEDPNQPIQEQVEGEENQNQQQNQEQNDNIYQNNGGQLEMTISQDMAGLQLNNNNNNQMTQKNKVNAFNNNNTNNSNINLRLKKASIKDIFQKSKVNQVNTKQNTATQNNNKINNNNNQDKINNNNNVNINNNMQEEDEYGLYEEEFQEEENFDEMMEQDEDLMKEMMQDENELEQEAQKLMDMQNQQFIEEQIKKNSIGQKVVKNKLKMVDSDDNEEYM